MLQILWFWKTLQSHKKSGIAELIVSQQNKDQSNCLQIWVKNQFKNKQLLILQQNQLQQLEN